MHFNLTRKQTDFIGATEQFSAYIGAIGTGKSTALIIKALFHSQESPNNLGVIVRKNFTDLRDSTIKDFETYTGFKVNESKKECILPNGSTILFRHGDELPVLKNLNLGFAAIEQAEEFPDSTTWEFLKMRLRRDCKHRNAFIVGNTAGHNWVWNIWKSPKTRQISNFRQSDGSMIPSTYENKVPQNTGFAVNSIEVIEETYTCPKNHMIVEAKTEDHSHILPPDYIENLKTLPEKLYKRYVLNSWDITEGLIYDEYNEQKHLVNPIDIPDSWERGFVLDHGFRNPTAGLWYAIDYDGNIWLYDEHYESEKPISYHAEKIKDRKLLQGYCDPSLFSKTQSKGNLIYSIADEYKDLGISLSPASRSNEDASIARVNEFFKAGKIKVFTTLTNFRKEIGAWKWKEVRPSAGNLNLPEVPEDKDNHLMDCIKYLIASRFSESEKPVETPATYSLEYYDRQAEHAKMLRDLHRKNR